ncbi:MAG TPA: hypothetical protein VG963_24720 [Polyangiaceae bacterium]|nr:hypothetical protein [Polyangiaceae bacterium]
MNDYQQIVSLLSTLLALPFWHAANVSAALHVEFVRKAGPAARGVHIYVAQSFPGFLKSRRSFIQHTAIKKAGE